MKVVIIGGVAGGASCAARLRRLDENAEIIILEKGNYISFANCGLPYHVGGVIPSRSSLLLQTPEVMKARFNIDVRVNHEAVNIDRERKCVTVSSLKEGKTYEESYDVLVIATGSSPVRPNIEGIDSERIKTVTTVDDTVRIREMVEEEEIEKVCVIGGGFIGLEMTENLVRAGKKVTLVEASDQLMNNLDKEMSLIVLKEVKKNGVEVILNDAVSAFEDVKEGISVKLSSGKEEKYGLVILAIGVRPNSALAKKAGLALG
ncbi:MAG: FAD-dependent oxidoreductase, partial [Erysipelotrichaceae bacterium]|nr:FAD-dependent oxidoreductase [Erysipelotrichaceae bacterium]